MFLDRDGTINVDKGYVYRPEDLELLPGSAEGIRILNEAGFLVIVITNQAGIARGYYTEKDVQVFHEHLQNVLNAEGAHIDAFYYCPHHPEGLPPYNVECECRKPKPGLILRAQADWDIDLHSSWFVGDKSTDLAAAKAAGCMAILIGSDQYCFRAIKSVEGPVMVSTVLNAANLIINSK
ncbi:D-glycero-alpha-D-manno-heptose-1,7-bisphosphate 7-phosphatase [Neomoorella glycerini]|uniref:D-glycero-alpha-D-manno-heptose-1,7-bisphosphate 7-phosphatase n=1 Tax=Neomoorella glycerini TaxID=55779 RepID=UPI0014792A82|nr:HAD family hydrolase [Moorella glycerini]